MHVQRDHTWHPWHRTTYEISACADYLRILPMTQPPNDSPPAQIGRFLRGLGQWGGLFIYYTDPRAGLVERLETQGHVTVDRSNSAYMVVTLTEQAAGYAPLYEAHDALEQETERLTIQIEALRTATPRTVYPALQAAARDLHQALEGVEAGDDEDLARAAAQHLLNALYDAKLITKPPVKA
jgi:hypothetical protein